MIKKIQSIKNFGIYHDFTWQGLPDFNEKNILYGWNYSGKTTFSRLFSSLRERKVHSGFPDSEFKFIFDDNTEISQATISACTLDVQVFNSEYIRENLRWETDNAINGITFDVGENVGIRENIEQNVIKIKAVTGNDLQAGKIEPYQAIAREFFQYEESKFSAESKSIKNNIFNSLIDFDKRHFNKVKDKVVGDLENYIISNDDDLLKVKKIALAANDRDAIPEVVLELNIDELYGNISRALASEPQAADIIANLNGSSTLSDWVKSGLELQVEMGETCAFCNNEITQERIRHLNAYFSNASSQLKDILKEYAVATDVQIEKLQQINLPPSKNDLFDFYQDEFDSQLQAYKELQQSLTAFLSNLKKQLNEKEKNNLFVSIQAVPLTDAPLEEMRDWLLKINRVIGEHNKFVENFVTLQDEARTKLKEHQVAIYLRNEDFIKKEKEKGHALRAAERYTKYVEALETQNRQLEAQLKSILAGREELNTFIQRFLGRKDVTIEVVEENKFVLRRGGKTAQHFSEGEKMAISFSYFLVSLESLFRDGRLFDSIIFIDDPISSLDSNHIAQIYGIINSFFFRQGINAEIPDQYVNCFKQLFISTHNADFFSFLKDSSRINRKNSYQYYFIKRISENSSVIQSLPKALMNYKSEYIYLFELIYSFYTNGNQEGDEKLILIPNAIRRFLEIYTLMKMPHSTDEIDARLKVLFPDFSQLKTLHHFSHFTNFEKVVKHDNLLMNVPAAVNELMELLKADALHLGSLKKAINIHEN